MMGFGVGFGLALCMLIWIGLEELRKKGLLNKESPNLLSAVAAACSAVATIILAGIGYQQWQVQAHTDTVQAAMSRAYLFPIAFKSEGPPALAQNFLATLRFKNGGPVPAFHVQQYVDAPEVIPLSKIFGDRHVFDADLMRRATRTSGGLLSGPDSCAEASKSLIESVVYPLPQGMGEQQPIVTPGRKVDQAVIDGSSFIFSRGCFVYQTAGIQHHSRFCYFYNTTLMKGEPSETAWVQCLSGVDAD